MVGTSPLFRTIFTFPSGSFPYAPRAGLVFANGVFYGTAVGGSNAGCGLVFSLTPDSRFVKFTERTLYTFRSSGDACGVYDRLLVVGSNLYGTTLPAGTANGGTVFSVPLAGGSDRILYSFKCGTDGCTPFGPLTLVGSSLYGTTLSGGHYGQGTVFRVPLSGGRESILYSFAGGSDGAHPRGHLAYSNGQLFGATENGGGSSMCPSGGCGTVFSLPLHGGLAKVLYAFKGAPDAATPIGGVELIGDRLVGAAINGGSPSSFGALFSAPPSGGPDTVSNYGALFSVSPSGGPDTILFSFPDNGGGASPNGGLRYLDGMLYGTTMNGGPSSPGIIFRVPLSGGPEDILHTFITSGEPQSGVIYVKRSFYGTTFQGKSSGSGGTVFKMTL
jgi:uncharacterized repeat protein (TIGR03803 family)